MLFPHQPLYSFFQRTRPTNTEIHTPPTYSSSSPSFRISDYICLGSSTRGNFLAKRSNFHTGNGSNQLETAFSLSSMRAKAMAGTLVLEPSTTDDCFGKRAVEICVCGWRSLPPEDFNTMSSGTFPPEYHLCTLRTALSVVGGNGWNIAPSFVG